MTGATDMSTPVTRGKLREELAELETRLEQKLEQKLEQRLAHLAPRTDLELWGGGLLARIERGEQRLLARIESGEQRLLELIDTTEKRSLVKLARHTMASHKKMLMQISIIDEKYAGLAPRMNRLETKVFARKQR